VTSAKSSHTAALVENTDRELPQMGRPKRGIQRKQSGIYQAVIWVDGKRHAKSLETRYGKVATLEQPRLYESLRRPFREVHRPDGMKGPLWERLSNSDVKVIA